MDRAKRDVKARCTNTDGLAKFYVERTVPLQTAETTTAAGAGTMTTSIQVRYDFQREVPRRVNLDLRTVNDAGITVKGTSGNFAACRQ